MRPRQPLRHIGEEALDLRGDAGFGIGLGDGREILGARLLAHPEDRRAAPGGNAARAAGTISLRM